MHITHCLTNSTHNTFPISSQLHDTNTVQPNLTLPKIAACVGESLRPARERRVRWCRLVVRAASKECSSPGVPLDSLTSTPLRNTSRSWLPRKCFPAALITCQRKVLISVCYFFLALQYGIDKTKVCKKKRKETCTVYPLKSIVLMFWNPQHKVKER